MIEFNATTHTYTVGGDVVPSVSQILKKTLFSDKFKFVKEEVLDRASEFGTNIHRALEMGFSDPLTEEEEIVYQKAIKIREEYFIVDLMKEKMIYSRLGFAGTLDAYSLVLGEKSVIDYKTTATLDIEWVEWQLSLYAEGLEELGFQVDKLYAIHIPKRGKGKLVEIKRKTKIEIAWLLTKWKEYGIN